MAGITGGKHIAANIAKRGISPQDTPPLNLYRIISPENLGFIFKPFYQFFQQIRLP